MVPKDDGLISPFFDTFLQGVFLKDPCALLPSMLVPFASLLAPFASLWQPFGSLLDPFGSLLALFGLLLVPESLKELFGTLSAKHPKTIPRGPSHPTVPMGLERTLPPALRSAQGPKAPRAC